MFSEFRAASPRETPGSPFNALKGRRCFLNIDKLTKFKKHENRHKMCRYEWFLISDRWFLTLSTPPDTFQTSELRPDPTFDDFVLHVFFVVPPQFLDMFGVTRWDDLEGNAASSWTFFPNQASLTDFLHTLFISIVRGAPDYWVPRSIGRSKISPKIIKLRTQKGAQTQTFLGEKMRAHSKQKLFKN